MSFHPTTPEGSKKSTFDTEKALNEKGFVEFLAKHDGSEGGEVSSKDMESRFEMFGVQAEVAKDIKEIYKSEVFRDIGITLDTKDMACVEEFLEKQAIDSPGEVSKMQAQIKQFRELPGQIKQANIEILEYVKNADVESLKIAKGGEGFWGKVRMMGEYSIPGGAGKTFLAREKVEQTGVKLTPEEIDKRIAEITAKQEKIIKTGIPLTPEAINARMAEITAQVDFSVKDFNSGKWMGVNEGLLEQFANVKKSIFMHSELREEINRITQQKLKVQLDAFVTKGDLKSAEGGLQRMSSVKSNNETGLDYMADGTEEEIRNSLGVNAEAHVQIKIDSMIRSMDFTSSNPFTKLQKVYDQAINTETVGERSGAESTTFIVDTINESIEALKENPDNKIEIRAKKILARQLAAKLSKNK